MLQKGIRCHFAALSPSCCVLHQELIALTSWIIRCDLHYSLHPARPKALPAAIHRHGLFQGRRAINRTLNPTRLCDGAAKSKRLSHANNGSKNEFETGRMARQWSEKFQVRSLFGSTLRSAKYSIALPSCAKDYRGSQSSKQNRKYAGRSATDAELANSPKVALLKGHTHYGGNRYVGE